MLIIMFANVAITISKFDAKIMFFFQSAKLLTEKLQNTVLFSSFSNGEIISSEDLDCHFRQFCPNEEGSTH